MKSIKLFTLILGMALVTTGCVAASSRQAEKGNASAPSAEVATTPFTTTDYAAILTRYVNADGLVNYSALQNDRQQLDRFNASIGTVSVVTYESWNDSQKIAFLMNAYNALTLQSIVDQKPLKKSIKDISGVWNGRRFEVVGEAKTLDNIEHDTLRKRFTEPRLHVALVCAAISCPDLRNEPYVGDRLDQQLDDQVKRFLNNPHKGLRIDRPNKRVYLSSIFKWYGDDWKAQYAIETGFAGSAKEKAVLNFISQYVAPADQEYLKKGGYEVRYLDYDWALNQQ
jgi:Protein of unknown function, DUF547